MAGRRSRPAVLGAAGRSRATGHEVVTPGLFGGRMAGDVDEGRGIMAEIGREEPARRAATAAAPAARAPASRRAGH